MPTIEETAKLLAEEHVQEDDEIRAVYWAPSNEEVRLIEVSAAVPDRDEALPFRFASDPPEIPYSSVVILLSPRDWARVQRHELELPSSFGSSLQPLLSR